MATLDSDRVPAGVRQLQWSGMFDNSPLPHAHRRLLIHTRLQVENDQGHGRAHDGPLRRIRRYLPRLQLRVVRVSHLSRGRMGDEGGSARRRCGQTVKTIQLLTRDKFIARIAFKSNLARA